MVKMGKVSYPAGSLVPVFDGIEELVENGTLRAVVVEKKKRPEPVKPKSKGVPHAAFVVDDPATGPLVPLRYLSDCLAMVDDIDVLKAMHELEGRKGGKDRIEERIGELTT
jgi:hypothetical protein|tara:strand:- start:216 stop:548 length:333 start_codon:yes stop_codon:yes gene_type:complete